MGTGIAFDSILLSSMKQQQQLLHLLLLLPYVRLSVCLLYRLQFDCPKLVSFVGTGTRQNNKKNNNNISRRISRDTYNLST